MLVIHLESGLTFYVFQMEIDGILTLIIPQKLHHEGNIQGDDGGPIAAGSTRFGEALKRKGWRY